MSTIGDWWKLHHEREASGTFAMAPRITCADGFNVSIQASRGHYCTPREYLPDGDYSAWEIGYPTQADELIIAFAEDHDQPLSTVYGYVPTDIVDALLARHGGIKEGK